MKTGSPAKEWRKEIRKPSATVSALVRKEEPSANMIVSGVMVLVIIFYLLLSLSFLARLYTGFYLSNFIILGNVLILAGSILNCWIRAGNNPKIKYEMIFVLLFSVFTINVITGFKIWILYAFPVILTCRYQNEKITVFSGIAAAVLNVLSAFVNAYGMSITGYMDLNTVSYAGTFSMKGTGFLFNDVILTRPDPKLILWNTLRLSTIGNLFVLLGITLACILVVRHGQKLMLEAEEAANARMAAEVQLEKSKLRLLNTQLQPHFLYNTLSAIMAIDGNPDETVDAIGEFGKYLRENLSSISEQERIPFSKELQHAIRYLALEQLRFGERLSVETDIQASDFSLPPLTVQILCENAVKHGITQRVEGGTVRITSAETETEFVISVEDDGVGFDPSTEIDTEKHVGLHNLRSRLETICGGSLEIISEPDAGTKVIVHLPKAGEKRVS